MITATRNSLVFRGVWRRWLAGRRTAAGARNEYFPIRDLAPYRENAFLLGFDAASEQREMLARVRDTGELVLSSPIKLMQEEAEGQDGLLLAQPVYTSARRLSTVAERHEGLLGYVIAALRVRDLFEAIIQTSTAPSGFDEYIFFGVLADPAHLVYVHASRLRPRESASLGFRPDFANPDLMQLLSFGGQPWTIVAVPLPAIYSVVPRADAWEVLVAGLLLTALVAVILLGTIRRAEDLRASASALTEAARIRKQAKQELAASKLEMDAIFATAVDGIVLVDAGTHRLVRGNRALSAMLGYSPAQIPTLSVEYLHPPESVAAVVRQLEAKTRGDAIAADVPVKRKDGSVFFADISTAPLTIGDRFYLTSVGSRCDGK